jgi:very-short-patch-repair endonuclease
LINCRAARRYSGASRILRQWGEARPLLRVKEAPMHRFTRRSEVSPVIELRARRKRSALTPSEEKLWAEIRGGRLGVSFRRQVPLGNYIADFAAPAAKLVVEVDGAYHARRQAADARRDRNLGRLGYRVLRLEASLVEKDLELAVARIRAALGE